jgi:hypothetical protein
MNAELESQATWDGLPSSAASEGEDWRYISEARDPVRGYHSVLPLQCCICTTQQLQQRVLLSIGRS